ncbi:hypothetical protein [Pseudorhodoferax aquiterrae]|uniref:hypothetical protein n=1 Tax=Pseudorhodoferax aquiterrae TaxID=747304 RepID=UPI00167772CE|nr:hypothetical protein [Pseudorhodoferax aquiterrae]
MTVTAAPAAEPQASALPDLGNPLAHGSCMVGGRPAALSDLRVPIAAVGTLTHRSSPWRSVCKLHRPGSDVAT